MVGPALPVANQGGVYVVITMEAEAKHQAKPKPKPKHQAKPKPKPKHQVDFMNLSDD